MIAEVTPPSQTSRKARLRSLPSDASTIQSRISSVIPASASPPTSMNSPAEERQRGPFDVLHDLLRVYAGDEDQHRSARNGDEPGVTSRRS